MIRIKASDSTEAYFGTMRPMFSFVCGLVSLLVVDARAEGHLSIACHESEGRLEIVYDGKTLLLYSFAASQFKPYVKEFRTLEGVNLLVDSPADHLHHHGLMYAIRVNGTNFWEEAPDAGRQEHLGMEGVQASDSPERSTARFVQRLNWTAKSKAPAVLTEERELVLTVEKASEEVALRWRSRFTVGSAPVKLHGSGYNGLGLRLPRSWDKTAIHRNSEGLPYTKEQKWDVTPARWAAVSHQRGDERGTVLLFGSPRNAGESRFFSMIDPFSYLSVTQNLDLKPLEYRPGEKFQLEYLVIACAGEKSSEEIARRYAQWMKEDSR